MSAQIEGKPVSIEHFAAALRSLPALAFDGTEQVFDFLKVTPVASDTLAPYLNWDRHHYTRNLIDTTPLYELIAICWEVGQISSVHNHQGQNCWMAAPMGRLLVQNYRTISQDLTGGKCKLEPADRVEMNPGHPCRVDPREPVHCVLNPREFNQRAVSLHVYSRPIDSCVVYSPEKGTCGTIKLHYTTKYGKPASNH